MPGVSEKNTYDPGPCPDVGMTPAPPARFHPDLQRTLVTMPPSPASNVEGHDCSQCAGMLIHACLAQGVRNPAAMRLDTPWYPHCLTQYRMVKRATRNLQYCAPQCLEWVLQDLPPLDEDAARESGLERRAEAMCSNGFRYPRVRLPFVPMPSPTPRPRPEAD